MSEVSQVGNAEAGAAAGGTVVDRLHDLVAEQLGVDRGDVRGDAEILDDLGADSLDVVELVMALEEAFDLEIPDEDIELMRTIADVEKYVASRVQATAT